MAGRILVTGATGNVSSGLIRELIAKGASVRALVRDASKAQGLRDAGVEVVIGDLDKPETLDGAFSGVDKVFLLTPPNPNQVTQARNGIAAAKRAGVAVVESLRSTLKNLKTVDIGPGAHFVQEDNPHKIGRKLVSWYKGL